jgi:hypothetical protein
MTTELGNKSDCVVKLTIRAVRRRDAPPMIRLRRLLKVLLRVYGWQVVECRQTQGCDENG